MNLLIIAYEFPPAAAGGVIGTVKIARYLPRFGWKPHLLAPSNTTVRSRDESMLDELGSEVVVHQSRSYEYRGSLTAQYVGRFQRELSARRLAGLLDRVVGTETVNQPVRAQAGPVVVGA